LSVDDATAVTLIHSRPPTTEHQNWDSAIAQVIVSRLDPSGAPWPAWLREAGRQELPGGNDDLIAQWVKSPTDQSITSPHEAYSQ
jgi:hypothetical protein